jgi:hypothetical protein
MAKCSFCHGKGCWACSSGSRSDKDDITTGGNSPEPEDEVTGDVEQILKGTSNHKHVYPLWETCPWENVYDRDSREFKYAVRRRKCAVKDCSVEEEEYSESWHLPGPD